MIDCRKTFCENLMVASVRTENKVVFVKIERLRNCGRFLTYRKVTRSLEEELFACINLFFFYVAKHLFEKTYREHIFIDIFKVFFGKDLFFERRLYGLVAFVDFDVSESYRPLFTGVLV